MVKVCLTPLSLLSLARPRETPTRVAKPPHGKSSQAIPILPQRPLIASSVRHACPSQYELRFWSTFKREFPECMGTANLNRVDFRSVSDGPELMLMQGRTVHNLIPRVISRSGKSGRRELQ